MKTGWECRTCKADVSITDAEITTVRNVTAIRFKCPNGCQ